MIKQTFNVWDYLWVHPFRAGMLEEDHPWITGRMPGSDRTIWGENIVYASPRRSGFALPEPEDDRKIVERIGAFLAAMVARSNVANPEIPHGPKRLMPDNAELRMQNAELRKGDEYSIEVLVPLLNS